MSHINSVYRVSKFSTLLIIVLCLLIHQVTIISAIQTSFDNLATLSPLPTKNVFSKLNRHKKFKMMNIRGGNLDSVINTNTITETTSIDNVQSNSYELKVYPHALSIHDCLAAYEVIISHGLSNSQVMERRVIHGENVLQDGEKESIWSLIREQFQDRLVQILLGVAILSSALAFIENDYHAFIEPIVILTILIANAFVGVYQSKSASSSLSSLKKLQPQDCFVLRNNQWISQFPVSELVPGDVISLRVGDKIPADCRILMIKSTSLSTDESSLTGESLSISKNTDPIDVNTITALKSNMLFSGTMITTGSCIAMVASTGLNTEIGKINTGVLKAQETQLKTPLTMKLDELGEQLTKIILIVCIGVWVLNIPKFSSPVFGSKLKGAIYFAKSAVALGVAAIPEGLPAVITLCLSLGTQRMAKKNVIVRKLPSIETLGCTTVICTDKTGTLTTNQMTVTSLVTFEMKELFHVHEHSISGVSYEPVGIIENIKHLSDSLIRNIIQIGYLCNDAAIEYKDGKFVRIGEPTEAALKVLVEKLGSNIHSQGVVADQSIEIAQFADFYGMSFSKNWERLAMLEFNRDRKSMSVLVRNNDQMNNNRLLVKGAGEMIVMRCNRIQLENGEIIPISDEIRDQLVAKVSELGLRPLRCLAMALRDSNDLNEELMEIKSEEDARLSNAFKDSSKFIEYESNMILVGLVGIKDPARPEVAVAINKCKTAGIRVMMMTGDSKETAVAIAKDVNILTGTEDLSRTAFTGREFFAFDNSKQMELLKEGNKVFCRTEPQDKQKLISMLEQLNEIPAMTGDGVNDAPALQQSAIGIAMGITGTEVAKNAADMILTDDNFASIVGAVEEGRNIYSNMQTFICFLISSNIGEILTMFFATLIGIPEPLTPLHLLWVNLVTDGPPATALGFNPTDPLIMERPPRSQYEPIMSKWMLVRYLLTGTYVSFATLMAFITWYSNQGISLWQLMNWSKCDKNSISCDIFASPQRNIAQSMSLSVLVTVEMLKAISAVSLDNSLIRVHPWRNPSLLVGVTIPYLIHLCIMYIPALSQILGISPLSKNEWKTVLLLSFPMLIIEEILKLIGRYFERVKLIQQNIATIQKKVESISNL